MGYRLEFKDPNNPDMIINDCGGKLFGYIDIDELHQCKSWIWMKENGFFNDISDVYDSSLHKIVRKDEYDDIYDVNWGYGLEHNMYLSKEKFRQFIMLYIEDRNKFYFNDSEYKDTIENYSEVLSLDVVQCLWF